MRAPRTRSRTPLSRISRAIRPITAGTSTNMVWMLSMPTRAPLSRRRDPHPGVREPRPPGRAGGGSHRCVGVLVCGDVVLGAAQQVGAADGVALPALDLPALGGMAGERDHAGVVQRPLLEG